MRSGKMGKNKFSIDGVFGKNKIGSGDEAVTLAKIGGEMNFASSEAYNTLRTNLKFAFPGSEGCKVIGITSSDPSEGKSVTSINLAYTLAKDGKRTLIVSGDMRKPAVEIYLGLGQSDSGLSNLLAGDMKQGGGCIVRSALNENLFILPSGEIPPNPSELIGSATMGKLIGALRKNYDYIIVDLPPVNAVVDAVEAAKYVDGMVLVIRHSFARKTAVTSVVKQLEYAGAKIVGFVYNAHSTESAKYGRKNYKKYGDYYGKAGKKKENGAE